MGKIPKEINKNKRLHFEVGEKSGKIIKKKNGKELDVPESMVVDAGLSRKILSTAKMQQIDLECYSLSKRNLDIDATCEEDLNVTEEDFPDLLKIDESDAKALSQFDTSINKSVKLSDVINRKADEKHFDIQNNIEECATIHLADIDPRVQQMYEGVRDVLKKYRSGKIPKAFKLIPNLRNWEQVLLITEPHNWTAAAMFQGTRLFCSILSQEMAQRFCNLVLLPRIRDDLKEYKKLNIHLYNALKKALFKPAAFMKGILLPLLESGDCSLREAIIIGSIIANNSIPVLHSSACLMKICEMDYAGPNAIFIRLLLNKRHALPYRVLDAVVHYFLKFENDKREMTVLWYQSLLTFAELYKNDISFEQKERLMHLLRKHTHPKITPCIRRELMCPK